MQAPWISERANYTDKSRCEIIMRPIVMTKAIALVLVSVCCLFFVACADKNLKSTKKPCINEEVELYFALKSDKEDYAKTLQYYAQACKEGCANGCYYYGYMYDGGGIKRNHKRAIKYYIKGCNLRDAYSCYALGYMHSNGEYVKQNYKKALQYYEKGCDLKEAPICGKIGRVYLEGESVEKD